MLHPQSVHLARELFAELLEELLVQKLLLERLQNSRLDLVAPDRQAVLASAPLARTEACEPVAAGHDEPSAADSALRQPGEQILRASCEADVAGTCDRVPRSALTVLHGVPEFVSHYPERRKLLGDPFCFRIQARDAFARVRILDVAQAVPDQATDVQLVVQDAGSAFRVSVNRAGTPASAERSGDPVLIQSLGNRFRGNAGDVLPEDPFHDRGFSWLDLSLTGCDDPAVQRLHHTIAVTESARRLATLDAPAQSSMRLVREVLQEQRVHCSLEPDVQVRDVALGDRHDVHAGERQTLEQTSRVFLVAAEAIERLGEHDVELAVQRIAHQRLESGAQQRRTRGRVVGELLHDRPALARGELAADPELVCD